MKIVNAFACVLGINLKTLKLSRMANDTLKQNKKITFIIFKTDDTSHVKEITFIIIFKTLKSIQYVRNKSNNQP